MSHKANYWLARLAPERVKAGAFRILFHLCDHHNGDRDPLRSCHPSQETLREKTGLSNGALNSALSDMEAEGLLVRRRSTVPGSSERRTYYILGCDFDLLKEQTPENGVSPNSGEPETANEQTPDFEGANSSLGPSKLRCTGEEPVRTYKKATKGANAQQHEDLVSEEFFAKLLLALGVVPSQPGRWWSGVGARRHVGSWRAAGLSEGQILSIARQSRTNHASPPDGPKGLDGLMQAAITAPSVQPRLSTEETLSRLAEMINGDGYFPPNGVSTSYAQQLLQAGLVTPETMRRRGIAA